MGETSDDRFTLGRTVIKTSEYLKYTVSYIHAFIILKAMGETHSCWVEFFSLLINCEMDMAEYFLTQNIYCFYLCIHFIGLILVVIGYNTGNSMGIFMSFLLWHSDMFSLWSCTCRRKSYRSITKFIIISFHLVSDCYCIRSAHKLAFSTKNGEIAVAHRIEQYFDEIRFYHFI